MVGQYLGTFSRILSGNGRTFFVRYSCHSRSALLRVFEMSIATVIGPTPPGTGVIQDATVEAEAKSTSPTRRWPDFLVASRRRVSAIHILWQGVNTRNVVCPDVDHNRAGFDPLSLDKLWFSNGRHHYIRMLELVNGQSMRNEGAGK